jgi:hypothetical protein
VKTWTPGWTVAVFAGAQAEAVAGIARKASRASEIARGWNFLESLIGGQYTHF